MGLYKVVITQVNCHKLWRQFDMDAKTASHHEPIENPFKMFSHEQQNNKQPTRNASSIIKNCYTSSRN